MKRVRVWPAAGGEGNHPVDYDGDEVRIGVDQDTGSLTVYGWQTEDIRRGVTTWRDGTWDRYETMELGPSQEEASLPVWTTDSIRAENISRGQIGRKVELGRMGPGGTLERLSIEGADLDPALFEFGRFTIQFKRLPT